MIRYTEMVGHVTSCVFSQVVGFIYKNVEAGSPADGCHEMRSLGRGLLTVSVKKMSRI